MKTILLTLIILILVIFNYFVYRDISSIKQKQDEIKEKLQYKDLGVVKVHYYTDLVSMTDSTPGITAYNEEVFEGGAACSPDMLQYLEKNDRIKFTENYEMKTWVVNDKMHTRHKRSIDIFMFVGKYSIKNGIIWCDNGDYIIAITKKHFDSIKGTLVWMPLDKCYITKSDWEKLNTTYDTRLFLVRADIKNGM